MPTGVTIDWAVMGVSMVKRRRSRLTYSEVFLLGHYWLRARLMHDHLHSLLDRYAGYEGEIEHAGLGVELEAYRDYWLSALYVLVEGMGKIGLQDRRVSRLFNENLGYLKQVRHSTYHFKSLPSHWSVSLVWAERLHAAIGEVVEHQLGVKVHAKRLAVVRAMRAAAQRGDQE